MGQLLRCVCACGALLCWWCYVTTLESDFQSQATSSLYPKDWSEAAHPVTQTHNYSTDTQYCERAHSFAYTHTVLSVCSEHTHTEHTHTAYIATSSQKATTSRFWASFSSRAVYFASAFPLPLSCCETMRQSKGYKMVSKTRRSRCVRQFTGVKLIWNWN